MKYSKDKKVVFNPENHTYYLGEKRLEGVTSFIGKYKNPFDADRIATEYARKRGLIKEDVLAAWKLEGEISCRNGSAVHQIIEDYINEGKYSLTGVSDKEEIAERFIDNVFKTKRLVPVETEMIVYNENIASQIDCIAKNEKGEHFILDWKTNKKIDKNSFGKFMFNPFNKLPDCNYYHYSLQLSIYKELCKEYDIKDCYIVHFDNENYNVMPIHKIKLEGLI